MTNDTKLENLEQMEKEMNDEMQLEDEAFERINDSEWKEILSDASCYGGGFGSDDQYYQELEAKIDDAYSTPPPQIREELCLSCGGTGFINENEVEETLTICDNCFGNGKLLE